jgi:hypothetical protein
MVRIDKLQQIVNHSRIHLENPARAQTRLEEYYQKFSFASAPLLDDHVISKVQCGEIFIRGLGHDLREQVKRRIPKTDGHLSLTRIYKVAKKIIEELNYSNDSDCSDTSDTGPEILRATTNDEKTMSVSDILKECAVQQHRQSIVIENMIKQFEETICGTPDNADPIGPHLKPPRCYFCGAIGHSITRCLKVKKYIDNGKAKWNCEGLLVTATGDPIPRGSNHGEVLQDGLDRFLSQESIIAEARQKATPFKQSLSPLPLATYRYCSKSTSASNLTAIPKMEFIQDDLPINWLDLVSDSYRALMNEEGYLLEEDRLIYRNDPPVLVLQSSLDHPNCSAQLLTGNQEANDTDSWFSNDGNPFGMDLEEIIPTSNWNQDPNRWNLVYPAENTDETLNCHVEETSRLETIKSPGTITINENLSTALPFNEDLVNSVLQQPEIPQDSNSAIRTVTPLSVPLATDPAADFSLNSDLQQDSLPTDSDLERFQTYSDHSDSKTWTSTRKPFKIKNIQSIWPGKNLSVQILNGCVSNKANQFASELETRLIQLSTTLQKIHSSKRHIFHLIQLPDEPGGPGTGTCI